jgi:hypothetical protein
MDQTTVQRPTGITVTAWVWIVTGVLMLLASVMGGFAYTMMRELGLPPGMPHDLPAEFALMGVLHRHFGVLLAVQAIVSVLAIWAGIALLGLRAWARTTIEVLSWLAFAYCIGFGILWGYLWVSITGQLPASEMPVDMGTIRLIGAVMGIVVVTIFAIPLWIMIRYLRGADVRKAIADARRAQRTG